jgi:hypothetical protein
MWCGLVFLAAAASAGSAALTFANPARAGWLAPQQVTPSTAGVPALAFDPAGNATIAFGQNSGTAPPGQTQSQGTQSQGIVLMQRQRGGTFGAQQLVPTAQAGGNDLGGLVLPKPGKTVLLVTYEDQLNGPREPWVALVRPAGRSSFLAPQTVWPLSTEHINERCCAELISTTRGEVIGRFYEDVGPERMRVLAPRASTFGGLKPLPAPGSAGSGNSLVPDGTGGVFDVWCRPTQAPGIPTGCDPGRIISDLMVAYRSYAGRFSRPVRIRCACYDTAVEAAGGRAHLALAWISHHTVYVAVGGRGGVSSPHRVAQSPGITQYSTLHAVVGSSGAPVVLWRDCAGACRERLAIGDARGRFTRPLTLGPTTNVVDDDAIASDPRGNLIATWSDQNGSLFGVACRTITRTCGPNHTISSAATDGSELAFGPRGEAIVVYQPEQTNSVFPLPPPPVFAEVYQTGS